MQPQAAMQADWQWLSLGENCLSDDILKRHGRKAFSTVYASARSNIDHALALEQRDYAGLLDPQQLARGEAFGQPVVRSTGIARSADIFDESCAQGFEFTHHDVIGSELHRDSYHRRIRRQLALRRRQNLVFLYHHRINAKSDLPQLLARLQAFQAHYQAPAARCVVVLFHQNLVAERAARRLDLRLAATDLLACTLHTEQLWSGGDQEIFWARIDDDLIRAMLAGIDHHLAATTQAEAVQTNARQPGAPPPR